MVMDAINKDGKNCRMMTKRSCMRLYLCSMCRCLVYGGFVC